REPRGHVAAIVFRGLRYRFSYERVGSHVNHGFDSMLSERLRERVTIKQVALNKRCIRRDCRAMTFVQAIVDDDFVPVAREFFTDNASDVPGAARHKRSHSVSSFLLFFGEFFQALLPRRQKYPRVLHSREDRVSRTRRGPRKLFSGYRYHRRVDSQKREQRAR